MKCTKQEKAEGSDLKIPIVIRLEWIETPQVNGNIFPSSMNVYWVSLPETVYQCAFVSLRIFSFLIQRHMRLGFISGFC